MSALNRSNIKLIYCYLVCLITVIYIVFKVASLTSDFFKMACFDATINLPHNLQAENYGNFGGERFKKMKPEKVEELRQQAIQVYAKEEPVRLKHRIIFDLPYLFTAIFALVVHALIIFKSKEKV